jgi:hypothetical protein
MGTGCDAEAEHTVGFLQYEIELCEHHADKFQKQVSGDRIH